MSVDLIRYDLLVQDALRGVVRRVLTDVARDGLPGDHHLYVSFDTQAPGVRLSPRLKERYPEEMTVVLQHQFWDLVVTDQFFEVGLSFNGIPERLHIPFAALKGFFDPSVKFGLQFEPMTDDELEDADEEAEEPAAPAPVTPISGARPTSVPSTRTAARSGGAAKEEAGKSDVGKSDVGKSETGKSDAAKSDSTRTEAKAPKPAPAAKAEPKAEPKPAPAAARAVDASRDAPEGKDGKAAGKSAAAKPSPASKADEGEAEPKDGGTGGAQVVRLDAFRKK